MLLAGALLAAGCELEFKGGQSEFGLSPHTRELLGGEGSESQALEAQLARLFGGVRDPRFAVPAEVLDQPGRHLEVAGLDLDGSRASERAASLAQSAALYGRKCLHCHGNEGGGDGVTAHSLRPVPRDFRQGVFKFHGLKHQARPEPIDLARVIREGVEGTAMPSFRDLSQAEIQGLAEFTRLLAMRGEVELLLASEHERGADFSDAAADEAFELVLERWVGTPRERLVAPPAPPASRASIERGFELFHDARGPNCAGCHGALGRGPGPAALAPSPQDPEARVPALFDLWGRAALPPDLSTARFLHGRRPADLYARIYLGIDGTPMAGIGDALAPGGARRFTDEDLWALVHFVRALSDPAWDDLRSELERRLP